MLANVDFLRKRRFSYEADETNTEFWSFSKFFHPFHRVSDLFSIFRKVMSG